LSFDVVFKAYDRVRAHVKRQPTNAAYDFVTRRLQRMQHLFLKWLDVYELYAKGYQNEMITWSRPYVIWDLSVFGNVVEESLPDVFEARIPKEVYVLLDDLFTQLYHGSDFYILANGDSFEEKSVYDEIYGRSLKHLTAPRPMKPSGEIDNVLKSIKNQDMVIFYYDRGQYDNAISWPLLVHECLHWLYGYEGLNTLETKCPKESWIDEVLIDIYVTNFFGPAYATSLASYLYSHPHEETITHPHFAVRLYTSAKYLNDLAMVPKSLPSPLDTQITDAIRYIDTVQERQAEVIQEVKDKVDQIYQVTKQPVEQLLRRKTKPFTAFIQDIEKQRDEILKFPKEQFPEKQILSIDDVLRYYKIGIPIAASPRVLFNAFISTEYLEKGVDALFVKESLKKWYVREFWNRMGKS